MPTRLTIIGGAELGAFVTAPFAKWYAAVHLHEVWYDQDGNRVPTYYEILLMGEIDTRALVLMAFPPLFKAII